MRRITVFTNLGKNLYDIDTNATTWGALQPVLRENGVELANMKAVIGENRLTIENSQAVLPEGDFKLFLMVEKTKSGMDRKELLESIKALIAAKPELKDKFKDGKLNMTQMKTPILESLYNEYKGSSTINATVKSTPKTTVNEVVDSVKNEIEAREQEEALGSYSLLHTLIESLMDEVIIINDNLLKSKVVDIQFYALRYFPDLTSEQAAKIKQQEEAIAKRKQQLDEEARKIASGMSGLRDM